MNVTSYQIGAIQIQFETDFAVSDSPSYAQFRAEGKSPEVRAVFSRVFEPPEQMGEPLFIDDVRVYECKTAFCRELLDFSGRPVAWSYLKKEGETALIDCFYLNGSEGELCSGRQLFKLIGLSSVMSRFNGLIFHAAHIKYGGGSILFSAPSQTGKSTQAELWKSFEGAEIINGDRALIRICGGEIFACGLPFSGTSEHCKNETAPLRAIAVLEQASVDSCERLSAAEAYKRLFSQTAILPFDRRFVENTAGLLAECLKKTPIYLLRCTPTRSAVTELLRAMEAEA